MTGGTKFSKRALKREIDRDLAVRAREVLTNLREKIAAARARRRSAHARAAERCRAARKVVRERQKAERARLRERLRAEFAAERQKLRQRCDARKAKIRALARRAEDAALREWDTERRYQAELRRAEAAFQRKTRATERRTAKERRAESDDEVRADIPQELVRVFERVKRSIRGKPNMSRAEVFLHWVHEHPDEVHAIQDAEAEKAFRKLLAEQTRLERARAPELRRAVRAAETALEGVPF